MHFSYKLEIISNKKLKKYMPYGLKLFLMESWKVERQKRKISKNINLLENNSLQDGKMVVWPHLQRQFSVINVLFIYIHQIHSYLSSPPHQQIAFKSIWIGLKYLQTKCMEVRVLGQMVHSILMALNPPFLLLMRCPLNQGNTVLR